MLVSTGAASGCCVAGEFAVVVVVEIVAFDVFSGGGGGVWSLISGAVDVADGVDVDDVDDVDDVGGSRDEYGGGEVASAGGDVASAGGDLSKAGRLGLGGLVVVPFPFLFVLAGMSVVGGVSYFRHISLRSHCGRCFSYSGQNATAGMPLFWRRERELVCWCAASMIVTAVAVAVVLRVRR